MDIEFKVGEIWECGPGIGMVGNDIRFVIVDGPNTFEVAGERTINASPDVVQTHNQILPSDTLELCRYQPGMTLDSELVNGVKIVGLVGWIPGFGTDAKGWAWTMYYAGGTMDVFSEALLDQSFHVVPSDGPARKGNSKCRCGSDALTLWNTVECFSPTCRLVQK
jgi:hypothetical protein